MAQSASSTVYHNWESVLDRKIDLLKRAAITNDPAQIAHIAHQGLSGVDYAATFWLRAKEHDEETQSLAAKQFQELEDLATNGTQATKEDYDKVQRQMEDFKDTPQGKEKAGWEDFLDRTIDEQKAKSNNRLEKLGTDGKNAISKMPESLREPAANAYGGALGAIADFVRKAVNWLTGAFGTVAEWYKNAGEKIKEWSNAVKDWFVEAYATVKGWFGGSVAQTAASAT